jgi:DNA-binding PadR family transcriptional regulator
MRTDLTKPEYAILSLLVEKPGHGYDLEQTIEARNMRDWTELAFSSIYYVLKRLEDRELIEVQIGQKSGKRSRKVYTATPSGRDLHQLMTLEFLGQAENLYPALLLGMANWPAVSTGKALDTLAQRKTIVEGILEDLRGKSHSQPVFVEVMFDYSIAHLEAELGWIDTALDKLGDTS